jgi:hypothetical protein
VAQVRDPQWFAQVVRHAAALVGLPTQAALAEAAGVSLNTVVNVVTGARDSYRPATLESLAVGLGVEAGRLRACATTGTATRSRRRVPDSGQAWAGVSALDAATRLVDGGAPQSDGVGGASFVVRVEGLESSEVERALATALARLAKTRAGARTRLDRLP